MKTLRGHVSGCLSVTFSKNARKLFSSGRDRVVRVWGVDEGNNKGWTPEQGYEPMIQMTKLEKKAHNILLKPLIVKAVPNDR